jgi:hypothetical protein
MPCTPYTVFNRLYESGEIPAEIIWKIIRKDGQERILEISASLIVDRAGKKTGFQGVARDVTQKIADQQELEASQRRSQELYRGQLPGRTALSGISGIFARSGFRFQHGQHGVLPQSRL